MSRFLNIIGPAAGAAGVMLVAAYFLADGFVVDAPEEPRRLTVATVPEASPGTAETEAGAEMAAADTEASAETEAAEAPADAADESEFAADGEAADTDGTEMASAEREAEPVADTETASDTGGEDLAVQIADASGAPQGDPMPQSVSLDLGRPATEAEVAAWNIDVRPDGQGLPEGSGNAIDGEVLYTERCSTCHGVFGEAVGRWPQLAGGWNTLESERPVKTIGSYWPYLSTVFDYVHRAMPFGEAQSLSNDETYAIVAYLLYLNDLVEDDFELSRENFAEVELPNEDAFFLDDRVDAEFAAFTGEVCMENCKENVEITGRARVVDVTPEDAAAREAREAAATGQDAGVTEADAGEAENMEVASVETTTEPETVSEEPDPELVAAGEKVFRQCQACHQVGEGAKNRIGPILTGIIGQTAGSVEGFKYSNALAAAQDEGLIWDEEALAAFLADPRGYLNGTKMAFRGLSDEADQEAVIAYLKSVE